MTHKDKDLEQALDNRLDKDHLRKGAPADTGIESAVDNRVADKARKLGLPTEMDESAAGKPTVDSNRTDRDDPPINPAAPIMNG